MTTTEIKNRTSETKLTRRNMLKSMAAASTATIVLSVGTDASGETAAPDGLTLQHLIENHQRAWRAFEDQCGEADDLERAYNTKFQRPLVPLTLTSEGSAPASYELNFDHSDDAERCIRRAHTELRTKYCGGLVKAMAPEHWQAMASAIDRSEAECMAALEQTIAEEEERREAFGLSEARRDWEMLSEAEDIALLAIMRHLPTTAAEVEEKVTYLLAWHSKGNMVEEHHFEALLQGQGAALGN